MYRLCSRTGYIKIPELQAGEIGRATYGWNQTCGYKAWIACFDSIKERPKDRQTDGRYCKRYFDQFVFASAWD